MKYEVILTPDFKRLFKRLSKKYSSINDDLRDLISILELKPETGISLGYGIFKIRMAIRSKGKGKSGGARIITYLISKDREIYLVHIYDKNQLENLTRDQIMILLKNAGLLDK